MVQKSYPIIRFIFIVIITLTVGFIPDGYAQNTNHLRYVDPFIGTTISNVPTRWGNYGGTYPGAVAPSGSIQLTPETRLSDVKGYDYVDSAIYYFSCFNHSSGYPEGSSGRLFVMPVNTNKFKTGEYRRYFSHADEVARPGYYKVVFNDDHTIVEATASTRTGLFRFTFSPHIVPRIFIGDAGEITMKSGKVLCGSNANTVINFSEEYLKKEQVNDGWIFTFASSDVKSKVIVFKLSKSSVGIESAQKNIDQETGNLDFDEIYKRTRNEWSQKLSVINVTDSNQTNKTIFYTALYHSLLIPWVISDVDGRYRGYDGMVHQKSGAYQYGKFSPWDTFRSLNPLLSLLYPDKEKDIMLSMLDVYKQTGRLPVGPMTGNHVVPIIVDSYLKGINGFDETLAYTAMKKSIIDSPFTHSDMGVYKKDGYVPDLFAESVTRTVEYAYDGWALSQFSKYIGNKNDYKILLNEGYNYRNLFNAETLFLLPRDKDKFKLQPGNSGYKEGDKWIYSYFVPQNVKDLVNLMGGGDQFANRLDSAFSNRLILFDNEPAFQIPYLFNQAGKPSLTQKWCREIMLTRYSADPGGIPGNDDLGSMSSWYVFSALGIYPVCPGRPFYTISSPLFQSATMHLANGKKFVINCVNSSLKNSFIQSLTVDGKPEKQVTISHSTLLKGGTMNFRMGKYAGKWAVGANPIELSETKKDPDFKFLSCAASKEKVKPDEQFVVHFSLINKGSVGTKIVKLYANGKQYAHKNCLVFPGKLKEDSITCRLYPVGKISLKIDDLPPIIMEVSSSKKKEYPFRITQLTAEPMVKQYSTEQINYTVQNVGGYDYVFYIPVTINDSLVFTDSIEIAAGAKKNIKHTIMSYQNGLKIIRVDSMVKRYKVYDDNLSSLLLDFPAIKNTGDNIIRDYSGFENNGDIIWSGSPDARKGNSNNGLLFGKDCFVEVPNSESLDVMGQTITMMAWVYPEKKKNGLVDILTKGDNHVLQIPDDKSLSFFAGGWGRGDCTVELPENWVQHWHHIAGVCTGKELYLFIDGILKGTTILKDTVNLSNSNNWNLGRNEEFPSERIFNGYMKMVKIFEAPLTQKEIDSIIEKEKAFINE